jgi:hypothetical protein
MIKEKKYRSRSYICHIFKNLSPKKCIISKTHINVPGYKTYLDYVTTKHWNYDSVSEV